MKRIGILLPAVVIAACSGHRSPPADAPAPVVGAVPPRSALPTRPSSANAATADSVVILPAPEVDTRIDAEIAAEFHLEADSAADAEMLERVASARPSGAADDTAADAETKAPGGGVTWDIDVASFNSHDRVQYYLDLFQGAARERMGIWLNRMPRYESMIRGRLQEQGLPGDMVYLALIESGFSNVATSSARAVGMWQFMRGTGRGYGLRIDGWVDERRDPFRATVAAAHYLKDLRDRFGSLYLAAAAYNAGAGKVGRGLNRMTDDEEDDADSVYSDSTFFRLYDTGFIRRETKDYVPKLIAAALIAKEPAKYGFHVAPDEPFAIDSIVVPDMTGLDVVARLADTTVAAIAELNPQYLRLATPPHTRSVVRVPAGRGERTAEGYAALPASARVSFVDHVVSRKETARSIAQRYGVTLSALTEANPTLRRHAPRSGQHVIVPVGGPMSLVVARRISAPEATEAEFHRVKRGETVGRIAGRYGISVAQLRRWNHLSARARVRAGQRLRIAPPPAQRAKAAGTRKAGTRVSHLSARVPASHLGPSAHRVAPGETLTGLARRYGVSVQALSAANGIASSSRLKAGTVLRIPG